MADHFHNIFKEIHFLRCQIIYVVYNFPASQKDNSCTTIVSWWYFTMADPGFPRGSTNPRSGEGGLPFGKHFCQKCMKMKGIEPGMGSSLALRPLVSATALRSAYTERQRQRQQWNTFWCLKIDFQASQCIQVVTLPFPLPLALDVGNSLVSCLGG